jgi:hypothetical protein
LTTAKLRRHPINLVFFLAIADFFFSLKWVLTSFIDDSQNLEKEAVRKKQPSPNTHNTTQREKKKNVFSSSSHNYFTKRLLA